MKRFAASIFSLWTSVVVLAVCVIVPNGPTPTSVVTASFFVFISPFEEVSVDVELEPTERAFMVVVPPERSSMGALLPFPLMTTSVSASGTELVLQLLPVSQAEDVPPTQVA